MCGFTFTVFLSAFLLLPTAPFHILDLGGIDVASGLFLGFLTYASAFSAPLDRRNRGPGRPAARAHHVQPRADDLLARLRRHPELPRAARPGPGARRLLVGPAVRVGRLHDHMLPESRRAEGIGYWGLSTHGGDRRRADGRLLDLHVGLGVAVHRVGAR